MHCGCNRFFYYRSVLLQTFALTHNYYIARSVFETLRTPVFLLCIFHTRAIQLYCGSTAAGGLQM